MNARLVALGAAAAILSGCPMPTALTPPMYDFNGFPYMRRESATAAYRSFFRDLLDQVEPLSEAVAGPARIVFPSKGAVLKSGLVDSGDARLRDFHADVVTAFYRMNADAIVRRNIFKRVELVSTHDAAHVDPEPGVAIIYLYASHENPGSRGWYFVTERAPRTRLHAAAGIKTDEELNQSFIRNVEEIARKYWSL